MLGSNGAGKTTTIKMLTTLWPPSSGEASVAGSLTGYEKLRIFAKLYDLPHREREARIREALEFMGLSADGGRLVGHSTLRTRGRCDMLQF